MPDTNTTQEIKKDKIGKYFFRAAICIEVLLLTLLVIVIFFHNLFGVKLSLFSIMGISIIILWIAVLIAYYAWAIYFYNINLGLTDHDWEQIALTRSTENPMEERDENPHSDESMGLPPGTVRGTIAITLLIGALAMTLVLFGEGSRLKDNEIFVDNFDFFKTAFLMMIAFYFGQKSLEYLLPKNGKESPVQQIQNEVNPNTIATNTTQPETKTDFNTNGAQG